MIRRPPISTRTVTLFPYTTLFRSASALHFAGELKAGNALLEPFTQQATPWGEDPRLRLQLRAEYATALVYMGEDERALQALQKLQAEATATLGSSDRDRKSTRLNSSH